MSKSPVLITIPISHYCEKARWALDRAGIDYEEQAHLQVLHWLPVRRAGGKKTAPVLVWGDRVFSDSADIVEAASAEAPPDRGLFSGDPAAAAEVRELQRDFDARLGPEGRRWMYNALRGQREIAVAYGCTGVPAWQRRALPFVYSTATRIPDR
jgi:glutathione S-transferase